MDVTVLMHRYRECARHIWNTYFCSSLDRPGSEDDYDQIRRSLFQALVVSHCRNEVQQALPVRIAPFESLPILVRRPSTDGNVYWNESVPATVDDDSLQLEFVDYYDFFDSRQKDFRFYRCRILKFAGHPEFEG